MWSDTILTGINSVLVEILVKICRPIYVCFFYLNFGSCLGIIQYPNYFYLWYRSNLQVIWGMVIKRILNKSKKEKKCNEKKRKKSQEYYLKKTLFYQMYVSVCKIVWIYIFTPIFELEHKKEPDAYTVYQLWTFRIKKRKTIDDKI